MKQRRREWVPKSQTKRRSNMPKRQKLTRLKNFDEFLPPPQAESKPLRFKAMNQSQQDLIDSIRDNDFTFVDGYAGTGKTACSVYCALDCLNKGIVDKILIARPAVEAGEKIGFLPGDKDEKIHNYLLPIFDELGKHLSQHEIKMYKSTGILEVAPIAFMRGRTFEKTFCIIDEASNLTKAQIKMVVTRLGKNGKMVILGDSTMSDLPNFQQGAFEETMDRLENIHGVGLVDMDPSSIVRHPLLGKIIERLDAEEDFSIEKDY